MIRILLTILALASFSTISQAACTRADLTGRWVIFTDDSAMLDSSITKCVVIFPSTGSVTSNALCQSIGYPSLRTSVTMSINSSCDVVGKLIMGNLPVYNFLAHVNTSKDVMNGGWHRSSSLGGALTGTK